jgi:hypothetical protein
MKKRTHAHTAKLLLAAVLFWGTLFNWATAAPPPDGGLRWWARGAHFGNVSNFGHIRLVESIGSIPFAKNRTIPVVAVFRTSAKTVSPFLGDDWNLPLLESIAFPKDKKTVEVRLPDGTAYYFSEIKAGEYRASRDWSATRTRDTLIVKSRFGAELVYKDGRLQSLKYPNGETLHYRYVDGRVAEITDGAKSLLRVIIENKTLILQINDGKKWVAHNFTLTPVFLNGNWERKVAAFSIDGVAQKTFAYKNSSKGILEMEVVHSEAIVSKDRQKVEARFPNDFDEEIDAKMPPDRHRFSWDARTGIVKTEDAWEYTITPAAYSGGYPAFRRSRIPADQRFYRAYGKEEEYWYNDLKNGRETTLRNGTLSEHTWFTSGALRGQTKTQRYEWHRGKNYSETSYFYNEKQRLAREIKDQNGKKSEILYVYDKRGLNVALIHDKKTIQEILPSGKKLGEEFLKNLLGEKIDAIKPSISQSAVLQTSASQAATSK